MQCSPFTYRVHIYSVRIRLEFKRNKINQIKTNTIIMLLLQEEIFLVLSGIQACTLDLTAGDYAEMLREDKRRKKEIEEQKQKRKEVREQKKKEKEVRIEAGRGRGRGRGREKGKEKAAVSEF